MFGFHCWLMLVVPLALLCALTSTPPTHIKYNNYVSMQSERNMPHKYGTKIPNSYFTKTQLLPEKPQKKGELNNFVQLCYRECEFSTTFLFKVFSSIYDNRGS